MSLDMKRKTEMLRKRPTSEEIVAKLRQIDVLLSQGKSVADVMRLIETTEVTYYRWPSSIFRTACLVKNSATSASSDLVAWRLFKACLNVEAASIMPFERISLARVGSSG